MAQVVNERAIVLIPDADGDVMSVNNDTGSTIEMGHVVEVGRFKGYCGGKTSNGLDIPDGENCSLHVAGLEAVFTAPLNTAHTNNYKIGVQVAIASGVVVPLGTSGSIPLRGFITVPKKDPVTAIGALTSDSGAAASGDSFIRLGMIPNYENGIVEDPGNAGLIDVAHNSLVELVSAGAETRTLSDPVDAGILLTLVMKTDGGDITMTASTAVNQAGNTSLTFDAVGECITLISVPDGSGGFRWSSIGNDGVTLA